MVVGLVLLCVRLVWPGWIVVCVNGEFYGPGVHLKNPLSPQKCYKKMTEFEFDHGNLVVIHTFIYSAAKGFTSGSKHSRKLQMIILDFTEMDGSNPKLTK